MTLHRVAYESQDGTAHLTVLCEECMLSFARRVGEVRTWAKRLEDPTGDCACEFCVDAMRRELGAAQ